MVDDRIGTAKGTAFDASVYTEEQQVTNLRQTKTAAAVEYFQRELDKAEEAIGNLEAKVEKQQGHFAAAEEALERAKQTRDNLQAELDSAQSQLEELVDEEVAP